MVQSHRRWAEFRFSLIGQLLAAPPEAGKLRAALAEIANKTWRHPINGETVSFSFATIERWYYAAKRSKVNPMRELGRCIRRDQGRSVVMTSVIREAVISQYREHKSWSYKLHVDNLVALTERDARLRPCPSYATIKRYMQANGLLPRRRPRGKNTEGLRQADARLESREVRSFEVQYFGALFHLDFHKARQQLILGDGSRVTPIALAVIDDYSRLLCHMQWYLHETCEDLVHGLSQAFMKRGLPRSLMTDNGSAMIADEFYQGLLRLGVTQKCILPYSAYQNGKQEHFWSRVEGRLMAMLEGKDDLTLKFLNDATQAWVEREYNRGVHGETKQKPIDRLLSGPSVVRASPGPEELRSAFRIEVERKQRRSDGSLVIDGVRFEVPSRLRHLPKLHVRYARWDLSFAHLVDHRTGDELARIFPLDKAANADGRRRSHTDPLVPTPTEEPQEYVTPPLLSKLLAEYAADGLPPAYIPREEKQ